MRAEKLFKPTEINGVNWLLNLNAKTIKTYICFSCLNEYLQPNSGVFLTKVIVLLLFGLLFSKLLTESDPESWR